MAEGLIWDKGAAKVDERLMCFLAGEDVRLDQDLFLYDITASKAHVNGLVRINVLSHEEGTKINAALDDLAHDFRQGQFVLDDRFEDGHSAIEAFLTDKLGDVGKKVHTGRSRNDQVLTATRLYLREALKQLTNHTRSIARACFDRAAADEKTPMPGYTHLQRAVPSTVGLWMAGFAEAFLDDADLAQATGDWINSSPLGTAAGYGVNLALDRQGVAEELEFARVQMNPMYAQNSRGKLEWQVLSAFAQVMFDIRRLAWDLSLFTTAEFGFVQLPDRYTTGSSIMPNKRNPDLIELLRAAPSSILGAMTEIQSLLSIPSGYQRDLQATKGPMIRAVSNGLAAAALVADLVESLEFDREAMKKAISPDMFATDRAVELTSEGVPFRDAYKQVAGELDQLADRTPEGSIDARVSPGGCGDLRLSELRARLDALTD